LPYLWGWWMPISVSEVFVSFSSLQSIYCCWCMFWAGCFWVFLFCCNQRGTFFKSSICAIYGAMQHSGQLQRFVKTGWLLLLYLSCQHLHLFLFQKSFMQHHSFYNILHITNSVSFSCCFFLLVQVWYLFHLITITTMNAHFCKWLFLFAINHTDRFFHFLLIAFLFPLTSLFVSIDFCLFFLFAVAYLLCLILYFLGHWASCSSYANTNIVIILV